MDHVCGICLSSPIELPVKMPDCPHIFCFLCAKSWSDRQKACPMCRSDIDGRFAVVPDLITTADSSSEIEYRWQYGGRRGGFWDYNPSANLEIENKYQEFVKLPDDLRNFQDRSSDSDSDSDSDSTSGYSTNSDEESSDSDSDSKPDSDAGGDLESGDPRKCLISIGPVIYWIDFQKMVQYPENFPNRTRPVRRVNKNDVNQYNCKGTAGLEKVLV